jgi:gliding motility-associated-like protein
VGREYLVTVITYTDPRSDANPNTASITLSWGDNNSETVQRSRLNPISSKIQENVYEARHTYATDGNFLVSVSDPNRVGGILNINNGNSRDLAFYVQSVITVNNSIQSNESPRLSNRPLDEGCTNFLYTHNPGAVDPDGDSLVYQLVSPMIGPGEDVPLYVPPFNTDSFTINPITGTVFWATPTRSGIYNIAIRIVEFRNGIFVGYVIRDMQIEIYTCPNTPPTLVPMADACVTAGENFSRTISGSDVNTNQVLTIEPIGGPFLQPFSPATISLPATGVINVTTQFNWRPICTNIRNQPHQILFKIRDNFAIPGNYTDGFFLKVNGPPVQNVRLVQEGRSAFRISWDEDTCKLATQYDVYRRIDSSKWNPPNCFTGIDPATGFVKIATIRLNETPNKFDTLDNDNERGLSPLITYCYRIVAKYPTRNALGAVIGGRMDESYASIEVCDQIIRSKPIITKASVERTSATNGLVRIEFLRPDTLDTTVYQAPYQLRFKRKERASSSYTTIQTFSYNTFAAIRDSFVLDSLINTESRQWQYEIDFYSNTSSNEKYIDSSPEATTVFTTSYATDKSNKLSWQVDVPWVNDTFVVYRKNASNVFDSVGYTTTLHFNDTGLTNGTTYCYRIESRGRYSTLNNPIRNFSQEVCSTPLDTIPPCPPALIVLPPCDGVVITTSNRLVWTQNTSCAQDLERYYVYYKKTVDDEWERIAQLSAGTNEYIDVRNEIKKSIAGCYAVTALDSNGNESQKTNETCIDNCPLYAIPNIFTPNNDGKNDLLNPFPYRFINAIEIKIYNRWGGLVYTTTNLDINWDGTEQQTGSPLPDGVYFYVCDIYERFLDGEKKRSIRGTVHLLR